MNRNALHTLRIAVVVSMGGFLFGFDASVISGVIRFIKPQFDLTDLQLGWVVSSPSFSAMIAMLLAGPVSDRIGRKRVLEIVAFLYIASAIMSAMAVGFEMLVVARMVGGAAFGAALVLAPMYIAEIAPPKTRGRLVSVQQLNIVLGFSAAYFSNYLIVGTLASSLDIADTVIWRWMLGVEAIPAILYFILLFAIPQSPRWLYAKGRLAEAREVLAELHGEENADEEMSELGDLVREQRRVAGVSYRELFAPALRFVLILGLTLGVLQQITGVNAIYFYATVIFERSGIGVNASFAQAVWVGLINVAFTVVALLLIDRVGRRPLLLTGLAGIALSMCITAYGFSEATYTLTSQGIARMEQVELATRLEPVADITFSNDVEFKQATRALLGAEGQRRLESVLIESAISMNPWLVLVGILGFVASFAVSLGPVMWVMLSEMFPNRLRAIGISVVGFVNSFVSWGVQFVFPWELTTLGNAATYLIYGVFALIGLVVMYRVLPETKGRSLEEIEREFAARS